MKRFLSLVLPAAGLLVLLVPLGASAAGAPSLSFDPNAWVYGDPTPIPPGATESKTFVLKNAPGRSATAALTVRITGPDAAAFTKKDDGCSGTSLGPNKSCSLRVEYSPSAAGAPQTATLMAMSKKPNATANASLTGHRTPENTAPIAVNDSYSVNENGTLNGSSVLDNDTDIDGGPLTAILVSGPANASSFTFNPDGTFSYVHNGSETTTDSFTYKANDGILDSNIATVTITVNPVNDAPVANNRSLQR